jgi:hypothetical protein
MARGGSASSTVEEGPMDIEGVKRKHEDRLLGLPNVVGVGTGADESGKRVITVFVTQKIPASSLQPQDIVPEELEGYETRVEEIGVVSAQNL